MKKLNKYFIGLLVLLSVNSFHSCTYLKKLDSGIRKTFGQVNRFQRQQKLYSKRLGIDENKKGKGENNEEFALQKNPIQQKNMINEYGYLFEGINGVSPGVIYQYSRSGVVSNAFELESDNFKHIKPEQEVFGWHPYWMGKSWENYPFELLSTLSYFSYSVDPLTGLSQNDEFLKEWKESDLIEQAKAKNTRVLLSVSLHGKNNQHDFLSREILWDNLFDQVAKLLVDHNADGIDLNFEDLPYLKSNEFVEFVSEFRQSLNQQFENSNREKPYISLTLPALKDRENYNVKALSKIVDLFIIMGYDYNSFESPDAISPLQAENGLSLRNSLSYYTNQKLPLEKTILALPYYGILWNIEPEKANSENYQASVERKLTYNEIKNLYLDKNFKAEQELDPVSMSQIYRIAFEDNTIKEIYYDDAFTLEKKFDFALQRNLKGVGLWALGYDGMHNEFWDLIESNFSENKKIVQDPIAEVNGYPIDLIKRLIINKNIFIAMIIYFSMALVFAFVLVLSDWRVRNSIYRNQVNQLIVIFIGAILLLPLIVFIDDLIVKAGGYIKSSWQSYIAFTFGIIVFLISSRIKFGSLREKP